MQSDNNYQKTKEDALSSPKHLKGGALHNDLLQRLAQNQINIKIRTIKPEEQQGTTPNATESCQNSGDELYFYHPDHLGSATFLTDHEGLPYQFFLNLPFGESMAEQRSYTGSFDNRWKFTGKELDEDTGLYYYGARFYNPSTSIWLSVDPLVELMPSFGGYTYNFNNPIMYTDPTGMMPEESGGDPKPSVSVFKVHRNAEGNYDAVLTRRTRGDAEGGHQNQYEVYGDDGMVSAIYSGQDSGHQLSQDGIKLDRIDYGDRVETFYQAFDWYNSDDNEASKFRQTAIDYTVGVLSFPVIAGLGLLIAEIHYAYKIHRAAKGGTQLKSTVGAARAGFTKLPKGFKETKQFGYQHGQKVYKYKGKYYSRDIDAHNGGAWKVFENEGGRLKRIGTADEFLNIFKQ